MALHTLYDAGTVFNYPAIRGGDFILEITNIVSIIITNNVSYF